MSDNLDLNAKITILYDDRGVRKAKADIKDLGEGAKVASKAMDSGTSEAKKFSAGMQNLTKADRTYRQSAADTFRLREMGFKDSGRAAADSFKLSQMYAADELKNAKDLLAVKADANKIQKASTSAAQYQNEARNTAELRAQQSVSEDLRMSIMRRYDDQAHRENSLNQAYRMNDQFNQKAANTRQRELATHAQALRMNAQITERAQAAQAKAEAQIIGQMSRARYALYDVATTYGAIATAALGLAGIWTAAGVSFEKDFANVIRTSGLTAQNDIDALQQSLINLSTSMPVSFGDLSSIATIGGQLGVAAQDVDSFADSIARFSATTDVSVETASKSLGRLAQLTNTPISQIENLSSSIYLTGINAVATEADILAIASQIATAGDLAGFSAAQIIGLSSAFASLGVAPERARGTVQRVFGQITKSISEGGDALDSFASISGMSADTVASTWGTDSQAVFSAFVEGLNDIQQAGGDTNAMLKDLGIGAVRDIQALQALSNNTEVYSAALADSATGFANGTETMEGYAIQTDTVAAKLQVLINSLKAIMAQANGNEAFKKFIAVLQRAADAALAFTATDLGGGIAAVAVAAIAAVGVLAAFRAGTALVTASIYGLRVATKSVTAETGQASIGLRVLVSELTKFTLGAQAASVGTVPLVAGLTRVGATATGASTSLNAAAISSGVARTGMLGAAGAASFLGGALKMTGIGLGITGLILAVDALTDSFESAESKAGKFFGTTAGLEDALRKDTEAGMTAAGAIGTLSSEIEVSTTKLSENAQGLGDAMGKQVDLSDATGTTTSEMKTQSIVVGQNTKEWVLNALATGDAADKMVEWYTKYGEAVGAVQGFDMSKLLDIALDPNGNVVAEIQKLRDAQTAIIEASKIANNGLADWSDPLVSGAAAANSGLRELQTVFGTVGTQIGATASRMEYQGAIAKATGVDLSALAGDAYETGDAMSSVEVAAETMANALGLISGVSIDAEQAMYDLGSAIGENGTMMDVFSESGRANLGAVQDAVTALAKSAGDDTGLFANNLAVMLANLQNAGVDTTNELSYVGQTLAELVNSQYGLDLDTSAAQQSINDFIAKAISALETRAALERANPTKFMPGAEESGSGRMLPAGAQDAETQKQIAALKTLQTQVQNVGKTGNAAGRSFGEGFQTARKAATAAGSASKKAGDEAKKAAEEFRTLVDYANDLASITSRAFEIRFSVSQSQDDVADQYDAIRKTAEDAAKAIADANQKIREIGDSIAELRASNKTLAYQLTVAVEYGDTLREAEIRAQMGKNSTSIKGLKDDRTEQQKALKTAQDSASTSLTGNTAASRKNREAVLALVKGYQDQISKLASSGASTEELAAKTEELRGEFVQQLTQMGFNRTEVGKYEAAFDDLSTAISNVPRNITVAANTNPAQQALNEFISRNANKSISITANVSTPGSIGGGAYNATGINVGSGGITTPSLRATNTVTKDFSSHKYHEAVGPGGAGGTTWYSTGGEAQYRASGGSAGTFPGGPRGTDTLPTWLTPGEFVQQKAAVDYYGLPFMNALNNMQIPRSMPAKAGSGTATNTGGGAGNAIQLVELLPNQVAQIVAAMQVNVSIDSSTVAGAANGFNKQASGRNST